MIIRKITIVTLAIHLAAALLTAAGSGAVLGVEQETGIGSTVEDVNDAAEEITSGPSGAFDAIVGLALAALELVVELIQLPFSLWTIMGNLGVPGEIRTALLGPMYVVVAIDLIAIKRGDSGI